MWTSIKDKNIEAKVVANYLSRQQILKGLALHMCQLASNNDIATQELTCPTYIFVCPNLLSIVVIFLAS